MNKLEQMQERARNEIIKTVFGTADPSIEVVSKIDQLITEVWNEAYKEGVQDGAKAQCEHEQTSVYLPCIQCFKEAFNDVDHPTPPQDTTKE